MSCVDIKNEKMIHPYIVTGTSASSDRKNESNGELFKLKIRENQDVDLKIANCWEETYRGFETDPDKSSAKWYFKRRNIHSH